MISKSILHATVVVFVFSGFINLSAASAALAAGGQPDNPVVQQRAVDQLIDRLTELNLDGTPAPSGLTEGFLAGQAGMVNVRKKAIVCDKLLDYILNNQALTEEQQVIVRQARQIIGWAQVKTPAKKQELMAKILGVLAGTLRDIASQASSTTRWLVVAGSTTVIASLISTKLAHSVACSMFPKSALNVMYNFGAETLNAALGTPLFPTC